MYQHQEYSSARPRSGYRRRNEGIDYDSYARVTGSPRTKPPPRPVSRRQMEGSTLNNTDSDDNYVPSSPDGPLVSPKSPTLDLDQQHSVNQMERIHKSSDLMMQSYSPTPSPRPPSSGSARASIVSGRKRSARIHKEKDIPQTPQFNSQDSLPSTSIRPPSAFSKYRLLPAIGTPTPSDYDDQQKFLFNDPPDNTFSTTAPFYNTADQGYPQASEYNNQYSNNSTDNHLSAPHGRISSAVSDISVLSTKANSSRRTSEYSAPSDLIERLDLSQLEKPAESTRRRKTSSNQNQSPLHKSKSGISIQSTSKFDAGELYDGDDDDSDTNNIDCVNTFVQEKKEQQVHGPSPSSSSSLGRKEPVIIPSQNDLAAANDKGQEILLAVKLPISGARHQRYFQRNESLTSIVEFAEEQAGQDFAGYILVSSAPKNLYEDLKLTIHEAGLEDRSVLHLEEVD